MYKNRQELEEIIDEKNGRKLPAYAMDWKTEFDYHRKYQEALVGVESFKVTPIGRETEYTNSVLIGQQPRTVDNIPKLKVKKFEWVNLNYI